MIVLNLTSMIPVPLRDFEVTMVRKACLNANESARKCVAYVSAINSKEALKAAEKIPARAAFKATQAREVK